MLKEQKPKRNNKFFFIVGFLMLLGISLGIILIIFGINHQENPFALVLIGMFILFLTFSIGSGLIIFRIARRFHFCEVCGERKVRIFQKKGDTTYFKYECPKCHEKREEYDIFN